MSCKPSAVTGKLEFQVIISHLKSFTEELLFKHIFMKSQPQV